MKMCMYTKTVVTRGVEESKTTIDASDGRVVIEQMIKLSPEDGVFGPSKIIVFDFPDEVKELCSFLKELLENEADV